MIRVLIADDEAPARAKLARWLDEEQGIMLIGEAGDGIGVATQIASLAPDVVFLDIRMPGLSGLEVAAQLDPAHAPLVVFVTAFEQHAIEAFELNAVDYLLKPYDRERLARTLERVRARLQEASPRGAAHNAVKAARALAAAPLARLLVPQGERLQLIDCESIHWIEADDNYVHLHTASARYTLRRPLAELLAQLNPARFLRVHRGAAVNLSEIASLEPLFKGDYEIRLKSGATVRLSRRFKDELLARINA